MSTPTTSATKTATMDEVQHFDRLIAKRGDIRKLVMPEYFSMPAWWVPTVKPKAGESLMERTIRDWTAWRKSYARTFRDKGLIKLDGVLFYAAKITAGVYCSMVRAGKRAYCLEYCRAFGTDETAFRAMVGLESFAPAVMVAIRAGNAYHKATRSDKSSAADVSGAMDSWVSAFDQAHEAMRAMDVPSSAVVAPIVDAATLAAFDAAADAKLPALNAAADAVLASDKTA